MRRGFSQHQAKYFANFLTREGFEDGDALTQSLSSARVDLNPHQVDAAMFALRSPLSKGVLLADEVGLGKTIEAALVLSQYWWSRQRNLLLVVPASLRKQWATELLEKFSLPSEILDAKRLKKIAASGRTSPIGRAEGIVIVSYEFAARMADAIRMVPWHLVVFDEAHKLRNVYRAADTSRAAVLRDALHGRQKLLLTATPLQNNLMELFGLISVIDDSYFGSEQAFRAEFGGREEVASQALLARRLEPICKRTLRRQVQKAGLINYTNRLAKTFDFTPAQLETDLYDLMSAYLQRTDTIALGQNGRHLVTLMLRKILGSSSFAVAQTLDKMVKRLQGKLIVDDETLEDIDGFAEEAEDWRDAGGGAEADAVEDHENDAIERIDPKQLQAEIDELTRYRDLAISIADNAKGRALLECLPHVLTEIVGKGGQRKAVIFTESVRTQSYLRDLLETNGFPGQTVVLNGSNSDKDSNAIYKAWINKHRGTEAVSGSKTADMKAAIVDAFRNDRTILIATESGAEGINLQFCSLLINYDLPWNPQRVEQRIGRCHRYGQKIDVKVTVPREDFIEKLRACRLAFEELGVDDGVIVARTDSLGAGLTQKVPVSQAPGDLAAEYIKWLRTEPISDANPMAEGELAIFQNGQFAKPVRLANGLFPFKENTGRARVIEDCIASLKHGGADLLWIETDTPNVDEIAGMVAEIRKEVPDAKLTYNNSPSFNWTLNLRNQVRAQWLAEGRIAAADYPEGVDLMKADYDATELGLEADARLQRFQTDISARAGVFHNLITLPTFHLTAKSVDELSRGYFGDEKMLAYVKTVQREEIRRGISAVKHQHEVGSDLGDTFKEMVSGERALKAGGTANTMNQFAAE